MEIEEDLKQAKEIAKKIIKGEIDPSEGCDQIAEVCKKLDYIDDLLEFFHLSHLQTGHEELGFNKENLKESIIEESRKLLKDI